MNVKLNSQTKLTIKKSPFFISFCFEIIFNSVFLLPTKEDIFVTISHSFLIKEPDSTTTDEALYFLPVNTILAFVIFLRLFYLLSFIFTFLANWHGLYIVESTKAFKLKFVYAKNRFLVLISVLLVFLIFFTFSIKSFEFTNKQYIDEILTTSTINQDRVRATFRFASLFESFWFTLSTITNSDHLISWLRRFVRTHLLRSFSCYYPGNPRHLAVLFPHHFSERIVGV